MIIEIRKAKKEALDDVALKFFPLIELIPGYYHKNKTQVYIVQG
jgi:hypothetical protein